MLTTKTSCVFAAITLALLGAGCSQAPSIAPASAPTQTATQAQFGSNASVVDLGYASGKTISLQLLQPADPGYKAFGVLDIQHHWVPLDIFMYTATLTAWNGAAYAQIASGVSTQVDPKAATPQTMAVFTNLKQGSRYQVNISAAGNVGGTAATTVLNGTTPTNVVYDFTATQDVQDTLSDSAAITFDTAPFNGSGTTTLTTPEDGTYTNSTSAEAGSAQ